MATTKTEQTPKETEENTEGIDPTLFIGYEDPEDRARRVGEKALAQGRKAAAALRG